MRLINLDTTRVFADFSRLDADRYGLKVFRSLASACQYSRLYRLARRWMPPGGQVLDWGCGNGHFSWFLERAGYRVQGFAFEDFPLRALLRGYRFKAGSPDQPTRLPYSAARFDAVTSIGVLEHVRETGGDELGSLREIARCLKPGGVFLCYHFPNRFTLVEGLARLLGNQPYTHPYRYTRADIVRLCRGAGLELVTVRRYGLLPRNFHNRTPAPLRRSALVASAWNALDATLGFLLSPFCQNYAFVARKRA